MSAQDINNPWKANQPGVPKEWTQVGAGGNAIVWSDGSHAIKRLKPNTGKEAKARFEREAQILLSLRGAEGLSLVHLHDVREREGKTEIVMDLMDGNLEAVIDRFSGFPEKAASALIPIAETLEALSHRENQIHHRDIKPSNLLFRGTEDTLYLADFGCAYLAEDERLTPTTRAMGAWAYRPPEYSVGRIEQVDEKGDVFSLAKVFWAMVNGERGVVFPGPVWFEKEYDLGSRYPENGKIHHAMLLISRAAAIRPNSRPSMSQFIEGLRTIANPSNIQRDETMTIEMLRAEALIEVEFQQRRASTVTFVRAVYSDLRSSIAHLHEGSPEVQVWKQWFDEAQRTNQTMETLEQQVAELESDASVVNVSFRRYSLNTRFYPASVAAPATFRASFAAATDQSIGSHLTVSNSSTGTTFTSVIIGEPANSGIYAGEVLENFLRQASHKLMVNGGS